MRAATLAVALVVMLAACDSGLPEVDDRAIVPEANYQARLEAMPAPTRDATLLRAIRDAGHACQNVQGSRPSGEVDDSPTWTATCENGVQWTVVIGRDGVAQVASTADLLAAAALRPRN